MKTTIEISNLTKKRISSDFVKKIVRKTVKLAETDLNCFDISIVFVGEAESRKINWKYRKYDKSTDVLSFNLNSGYNKNGKSLEGELVLCSNVIAKNARDNKVEFLRELAFVLAHGVLHVLGWRHGKKMFEAQDRISNLKL
ncbi:MAG: rRNA maturation RNase YbeY [Candidatus Moranbacteria bacterium]|nr:rRNA maturation RNase YbeY [Candidatus Moranbacteria bacterium]